VTPRPDWQFEEFHLASESTDSADDLAEVDAHMTSLGYSPTPPFVLLDDDSSFDHMDRHSASPPILKAKASPRIAPVNKYWFNPSWINEDAEPETYHGEFQTPVWLAVELSMHADRERDPDHGERRDPNSPMRGPARKANNGQLRTLLSCIASSNDLSTKSRTSVLPVNDPVVAKVPQADVRYHELSRHQKSRPRKFARFLVSNLRRVSVNHN
jgi:hypothetical protein